MSLTLLGRVDLPSDNGGGFDHADVLLPGGRLFVAHTANGTVEVVEGEGFRHVATIPGCPGASGVLCAQAETWMFAAAREGGHLLVVDGATLERVRTITVGPRPNGLAWDPDRHGLLVADVEQDNARLIDPTTGVTRAITSLPGRPRWCVYDRARGRFLVNIQDPPVVASLDATSNQLQGVIPIACAGPHGLDIDPGADRAFVACDGGEVVVVDLRADRPVAAVPISGPPDAIWFNRQRNRLYIAIGDPGLVEVVNGETLAVCDRIATAPGAHTTGFDADRQLLYAFLPASCQVAAYGEV